MLIGDTKSFKTNTKFLKPDSEADYTNIQILQQGKLYIHTYLHIASRKATILLILQPIVNPSPEVYRTNMKECEHLTIIYKQDCFAKSFNLKLYAQLLL